MKILLLVGFTLLYWLAATTAGYWVIRLVEPGCLYGYGCNTSYLVVGGVTVVLLYMLGLLIIAQARP